MKKQQTQIAILAALVVAAGMVWYVEREKPVLGIANRQFTLQAYQPLPVDNPALHWDVLHHTQQTEYKGSGRNPFVMQAEAATASTQIAKNAEKPFEPQGPRTVPPPQPPTWPGNVSFFGYGTVPNGTARRAFLSVDGEVQVVGEGDTLLGRYRILQINNGNLEFQDISTGLSSTKVLDADKSAPPAA